MLSEVTTGGSGNLKMDSTGESCRITHLQLNAAVSSYVGSIFAACVLSEVITGPLGARLTICEKHINSHKRDSMLVCCHVEFS